MGFQPKDKGCKGLSRERLLGYQMSTSSAYTNRKLVEGGIPKINVKSNVFQLVRYPRITLNVYGFPSATLPALAILSLAISISYMFRQPHVFALRLIDHLLVQ